MKKAIIAAAALAALSSSAFAAPATGLPNTITFIGEIVASACGIDEDTGDQIVELGSVPAGEFTKVGDRSSTVAPFGIVLTDCDTTTANSAYFTFTGSSDADVPSLFAVRGGAGNVGIRLQTSAGEYLDNGVEQTSAVVLSNGNNTARFAAMYEATQATVTPGTAIAVANFTVRYQ